MPYPRVLQQYSYAAYRTLNTSCLLQRQWSNHSATELTVYTLLQVQLQLVCNCNAEPLTFVKLIIV